MGNLSQTVGDALGVNKPDLLNPSIFPITGVQGTGIDAIPAMAGDPTPVTQAPQAQSPLATITGSSIQDGSVDDIPVTGFKQTHRNLLGRIADAVLVAYGEKPVYENRMRERDMTRAMEGFSHDPLGTIQRMAQIPGMANEAMKYYDQYTDNQRQQGNLDRQNNVFDLKKEDIVFNRVAGMMGAANEKTWSKMRQVAQAIGQKYGVDVSPYIPEQYDPDSVDFMRQGAIKPLDQEKLQETSDYHDRTIDTRQRGQDIRHGDTVRGQDLAHQDRGMAQDRQDQRQERSIEARPNRGGARTTMTKYGPGLISPDGNKMMVTHQGKKFGYLNVNGTWVPVGEIKGK